MFYIGLKRDDGGDERGERSRHVEAVCRYPTWIPVVAGRYLYPIVRFRPRSRVAGDTGCGL